MILIYQILAVVLLIVLGGFFAGSETGVYRLSRFRLRLGAEQKKPSFEILARLMQDSHGLVLSMLLSTNLVHCAVTSIVTIMLLKGDSTSRAAELYATVIMAPVLFIFSEVTPKNIYYYRADALLIRFAPVLWFVNKFFTYTGVIGLLKLVFRFFAWILHSPPATGTV